MKVLCSVLSLVIVAGQLAFAQPFTVDSNTVALWHFDEISGIVVNDATPFHNNGTSYEATIVPGKFGNGRFFNGTSASIDVPAPNNGSLDFGVNQSFTIEAWFRSTAGGVQEIVRRGLAPYAGYDLRLNSGHVQAEIGNRLDGLPPDTVLIITSTEEFTDGAWHLAAIVRDRAAQKLFLYVDNAPAAQPMEDHFPYPLSNTLALNIGYWQALGGVEFFHGTLDEIRISKVARHPVTSDTVALWHMDELSGQNVFDSSPYHNNGTANGTTIIPSEFGHARHFNGQGDYIAVPHSNAFNFTAAQSFTIDAWFRTTATDTGEILRYGLAPFPGYLLRIFNGHVQGTIGDREDMPPPSMLVRITSTSLYNNGEWHHALLIRDRSEGKLFLYVDGIQAAPAVNDGYTLPIASDRPLMMGRWENYTYPTYFRGDIDEVKIFRGARHPGSLSNPEIRVSPLTLDYGPVIVGSVAHETISIENTGAHDSLRVTGITSDEPVFAPATTTLVVPPGATQMVIINYAPVAAQTSSGTLSIASNDPVRPVVHVSLHGRGIQLQSAPVIASVRDIPNDQGKQVRVIWYRSIFDGINDSLHIASYSIWRRVDDGVPVSAPEGSLVTRNGHVFLYSANELWDFIVTIPAVRFAEYSYVAPTLFDSTIINGIHWTAFKVSAHTASDIVFFSAPDSGYSVDNLPPRPPVNLSLTRTAGGVSLTWEAPLDPDIRNYVVHRSTEANFVPTAQTLIGSPSATSFSDNQVSGLPAVYYKLATVDSAGNQSEFAGEVGLLLTGTGGNGALPTEFALYQNYPNPFNPATVIRYDVPSASHVLISVYDVTGREMARLVDDWTPAGRYSTSWSPDRMSSGLYFYRLMAGGLSFTRKMLLIR